MDKDAIAALHRRRVEYQARACGLRRELGESDADFEKRVDEAVAKLPPRKRYPFPKNPAWGR